MHGFYTTVWVNNPVSQQRGSNFSCCGTCTNSNASSPVQKAHLQSRGASAPVTCPGAPSHLWVAACCASVTLLTQDNRTLGVVSCFPSGGEDCRDSAFSAPDGLAPHSLRDLDKSIKTCFFYYQTQLSSIRLVDKEVISTSHGLLDRLLLLRLGILQFL